MVYAMAWTIMHTSVRKGYSIAYGMPYTMACIHISGMYIMDIYIYNTAWKSTSVNKNEITSLVFMVLYHWTVLYGFDVVYNFDLLYFMFASEDKCIPLCFRVCLGNSLWITNFFLSLFFHFLSFPFLLFPSLAVLKRFVHSCEAFWQATTDGS